MQKIPTLAYPQAENGFRYLRNLIFYILSREISTL